MGKIATYASKTPPLLAADKIIGTNSVDGTTKNFTLGELDDFFSEEIKVKTIADLPVAAGGFIDLPGGHYEAIDPIVFTGILTPYTQHLD